MSDSSTGIDSPNPSSPDYAPKPSRHPDESTASESLNNLEATWTDIRLGGDGLPSVPGYEIISTLGHGGMGVVYKALQVRANRLVALKMIKDRGPASPELLARFRTEIEAVASLQNPQVVQIFEVGEFDGQPYFSMEFCSGGNLKERLRGQPQPPLEAAALVELLARGVHAAHCKGVVHRDLKPANVLIDEAGHLKVSDFGLAKRIDREGHTNTGAVLGTPSYMAPEQAVGNVHDIGPRTDVYALGAILYECLTGRPPFQAPSDLEIMAKVVAAEPIQPSRLQSGVPRQLETVVLKALEKTTARRYATAKDLADDLARFQSGESVLAVRAGPLRRLGVYVRRRPTIAALCALIVFMALSTAVGFVWAYTQALSLLDKTRAANQQSIRTRLEQLRTAAPGAVPQLLRSLREDGVASADQLRELWSQTDAGEKLSRVRLGLALLPDDPSVRDELTQWMLDADDLRETLLTRDALTPFAPELTPRLWRVVDDPDEVTSRQWRALAALAAFDPASDRWKAMGPEIAEHLLTANPLTIGAWTDAFRPLRAELLESLKAAFVSQQLADKRAAAASVLADFSRDQPEVLPEMIEHADEPALLKPLLDDQRDLALRLLRPRLDATPGPLCDCTSTRLARVHRQAAAAAALMAIGDDADIWRLFARSEDPTLRSHLVYDMAALDIDPRRIAHRLKDESDPGIRQALILALGDYTAGRLPHSARATLTPILLKWYREDPDPGVHSSIDWLLRPTNEGLDCRKISWGEADGLARIDRELAERPRPPDRRWLVTKHGHTLAIVAGPVEAHLGDSNSDINIAAQEPPDPQWVRNIPRSFGIATRLVTVRQFNEFLAAEPPGVEPPKELAKKALDLPINGVNWYTAAKYCRWLSEREAVPAEQMCYPAMDQIKDGMILPSDYLQRTGYRVPTEAEWEFAARAGAATIWCCGDDPSMLGRYVVYAKNGLGRVWPVGQKRPNDLGLFEPHGTLWNWCSDAWDEAPSSGDDDHPASSLSDTQRRVLRGGSFGDGDVNARCSNRNGSALVNGMSHGLRIARTIR